MGLEPTNQLHLLTNMLLSQAKQESQQYQMQTKKKNNNKIAMKKENKCQGRLTRYWIDKEWELLNKPKKMIMHQAEKDNQE